MTLLLPAIAGAYLQAPFSIFDEPTTTALAQVGWHHLAAARGFAPAQYSTANCLVVDQVLPVHPTHPALTLADTVVIEEPYFQRLQAFYDEHGLEPSSLAELLNAQAPAKLRRALAVLAEVPPAYACVQALVRAVQVLRQPDPEIDVSYSHPAVPFSIFVTVCEEDSDLAALRVAEAILHETMHLHLTLLERVVDLVQPDSPAVYYSPWREEDRPVRGVLHGLFVFRAVQAFYQTLLTTTGYPAELASCAATRIEAITQEVQLLADFPAAAGLTPAGRQLATNLLLYHTALDSPKNYAGSQ